jgi:hypothetical protein
MPATLRNAMRGRRLPFCATRGAPFEGDCIRSGRNRARGPSSTDCAGCRRGRSQSCCSERGRAGARCSASLARTPATCARPLPERGLCRRTLRANPASLLFAVFPTLQNPDRPRGQAPAQAFSGPGGGLLAPTQAPPCTDRGRERPSSERPDAAPTRRGGPRGPSSGRRRAAAASAAGSPDRP